VLAIVGGAPAVAPCRAAAPHAADVAAQAEPSPQAGPNPRAEPSPRAEPASDAEPTSYNQIIATTLQPQAEDLLKKLVQYGRALRLEGVPVFDGTDKFLPGKIAVGLTDFILALPRNDPRVPDYLVSFRRVAASTVDDANDTWGIYYYLLALNGLRKAGMLHQALDRLTVAKLRVKLDWRTFVDPADYTLIDHPNNYYCVALGIARLRAQMGWEDGIPAERLFAKILDQYHRYSGDYGFSDETNGEGRFDRYSVLLAGEIAHHFLETDGQVPAEALSWLRKAANVMLVRMHASGEGFEYGRSLGPYGETAIIEVLTAAAQVGILTPREKDLGYSYAATAAKRYVDFWLDKSTGSVDLWSRGRRTDAYRGPFRRFGENLSLAHQFSYTNAIWNELGYRDKPPVPDFARALHELPEQTVTWFARGEYDRVLLTRRDADHVIGLPLISGGTSQHMHSPYFPIPFSRGMLSGVADGTKPLLLPQFILNDGSRLMPLAFIRGVSITSQGRRTRVTYHQTELDRLGSESPTADQRLSVATTYVFDPTRITRTDIYTPKEPLQLTGIELDFGTFSQLAHSGQHLVEFSGGAITSLQVRGLDSCRATAIDHDPDFESDEGPMTAKVVCTSPARIVSSPFTIGWTITFH
jgi:hypothetical protein